MADAIIEVKDVEFRYEGAEEEAVAGVSLRVERGEFVAVLGRNGSGKSTLAKLLNALNIPQKGEIWIDGVAAHEEANSLEVRKRCGMVFQNPDNQIVATVVEEDCAFGLENLGVAPDEIRRRVDGALAAVGMRDHAEAAPHMLSGGQKQRVAIAGVLAMRPKIIVFDESTAMLDPSGRRELFSVAEELNRRDGITIVWITHFMDEALRVVGMRDYAEAAPHMLSGGQKQRVAIAGVLAMRPKIIVFDESTAMLDPSGRREVFAVAEELNRRDGITIVWITHFMDEALRAGRVLVMDAGKIALEGVPRDVFQKTEEIRKMGLDVPPMAQLAAQLRLDGVPLRAGIMTVEEMAVELCRLKSAN